MDNPPFSILNEILRYYREREIPFFLFTPHLTNFSSMELANHIICEESIVYENGAVVATSFVTSFGEWFIDSAPTLAEAIKAENRKNKEKKKVTSPKYEYPNEVLTATMVGAMAKRGIDFKVRREDCQFIRALDSQRTYKKTIFGGGFLLSEKAAAEKAAAEKAAAEKAAAEKAAAEKKEAYVWALSDEERHIIKNLGEKGIK